MGLWEEVAGRENKTRSCEELKRKGTGHEEVEKTFYDSRPIFVE